MFLRLHLGATIKARSITAATRERLHWFHQIFEDMKNSEMLAAALVAGLLLGGCSKAGKQAAAVNLEDVPQTMEKAFRKNAKPEVTELVNKAVTDLQQRNPEALQELHEISTTSEMTPEQRSAI